MAKKMCGETIATHWVYRVEAFEKFASGYMIFFKINSMKKGIGLNLRDR